MLDIAKQYDQIASSYENADRFGVISSAQRTVEQQIFSEINKNTLPKKIIDFGIGDGMFVKYLKELLPTTEFYGVDISQNMLDSALKNTQFVPINCGVSEVNQHVPKAEMDMVLTHFILAYVPISEVIKQVHYVLKPGGLFSIATSLKESYPEILNYATKMSRSWNPLMRIMASKVIKEANASLIESSTALEERLEKAELEILAKKILPIPTNFATPDEMINYFFHSGWAIHTNQKTNVNSWLIKIAIKLVLNFVTFPFHDEQCIEVILCRKKIP
jgi:ubiquinone/menaquinone biosynthesis C-methylase UbiE